MSQRTNMWRRGAVLLGLSCLAVARPATGQEDQAAPVAPSPRELTAGHPLASRATLLDSAQRGAAAGDPVRAAAIRARLAEGDFQPGERVWLRLERRGPTVRTLI